jgi:energy-coupling factor transport system permease protein
MLDAKGKGPGSSLLAQRNPVIKLVVFCAFTFAPIFFLDPYTPLAFLLLGWAAAWPLARIAPWVMVWRLRPYLMLAAGLAIFNAFFYGGESQSTVWQSTGWQITVSHSTVWAVGPLRLTREGVAFGAAVALRLLCMITYTTLFFATTEPIQLVNSLILQARLPYRLAFTILATYRFLPILQEEMAQIGAAQRIRAVYSPHCHTPYRSLSLQAVRRFTIPLLAGGIRRAERLALAMDGRGFGARPTRSTYLPTRVGWSDKLFLLVALMVTGGILLALAQWGLLSGWLVGEAEELAGGKG